MNCIYNGIDRFMGLGRKSPSFYGSIFHSQSTMTFKDAIFKSNISQGTCQDFIFMFVFRTSPLAIIIGSRGDYNAPRRLHVHVFILHFTFVPFIL